MWIHFIQFPNKRNRYRGCLVKWIHQYLILSWDDSIHIFVCAIQAMKDTTVLLLWKMWMAVNPISNSAAFFVSSNLQVWRRRCCRVWWQGASRPETYGRLRGQKTAGSRDGAVMSRGWVIHNMQVTTTVCHYVLPVTAMAVRCPMFINWLFWFVRFDIDLQRHRKWQLAMFALLTQFHLRCPWEWLNLAASDLKRIHFIEFIEEVPARIGYRIQPDVNTGMW